MNELLVRSLTPTELAERMRDHEDPAVVRLAQIVIDGDVQLIEERISLKDRIYSLENSLNEQESVAIRLEDEVGELKELLEKCITHIPDNQPELYDEVRLATK